MTIRTLASTFFFLYGLLVPILATSFVEENFFATLAIIGSCLVISILLLIRRAVLLNILISFYVFKAYLTRPYVDIFLSKLTNNQLNYIETNNYFFNSSDASVVYFGLLSLLVAWLIGLIIAQPKKIKVVTPPWIFHQVDKIVSNVNWRFWLVWLLLIILNYMPANENWEGIATGEGNALFALGLTSPYTISIVCFFAFLTYRHSGDRRASLMLIVPILYYIVIGTISGSRGAAFLIFSYMMLFLIYLNYDKRIHISRRNLKFVSLMTVLAPIIIFAGLIAQSIKPLLRTVGIDNELILEAVLHNLNVLDPNNTIYNNLFFGLTEILHRLSSLQTQFLILNDHFINTPWETFNPLQTVMRTINDIVPGSLFPDMVTINQLFHHIYFDTLVTYSSHMWSIQGTLYLYFGLWLSPIIVMLMAYFVGRRSMKFEYLTKLSFSFTVFSILIFDAILANGTVERIIPVDVIRPLFSFVTFIFLVRLLYILFPAMNKSRLS
jgi:hypothetical protein